MAGHWLMIGSYIQLPAVAYNYNVYLQAIAQTLLLSIDEFVIELLLRIFEPHSSKSHLAQFCLPSDPEPCSPHYTSNVIRATFDYMPTCYGSSAQGTPFLRLLSKRNVSDSLCVYLIVEPLNVDFLKSGHPILSGHSNVIKLGTA